MSGKRSSLQRRALSAWPLGAALSAVPAAVAHAQGCPTAQSGKAGFVVQRGEQQKTEVFHIEDGVVRTVMRYNGAVLLETTQQQGLFQLDRLDRGLRTKYEAQTDLKSLFPLQPGRTVRAKFATESNNGERGTLSVEMAVKGRDTVYVGPCRYDVLKIDRAESYNGASPRFVDTDYYSPELKLILAKEYRKSGSTDMIKYDRIYSLKPDP